MDTEFELQNKIQIIKMNLLLLYFKKNFKDFYLFLERGEGSKRERNIDVQEKHRLVVSCTPPTEDLACNPGMCSHWESIQ